MEIQELIQRNYEATVKRGKITVYTEQSEFVEKLKEEVRELESAVDLPFFNYTTERNNEMADCALVLFAMAKHFDIDLLKAMEEKTIFNEQRKD